MTLRLIPLKIGAHPALQSTFVILDFDNTSVNDVVYVEGAVGNIYLESATDLERYKKMWSRLEAIALSPGDSVSLISGIVSSYESG